MTWCGCRTACIRASPGRLACACIAFTHIMYECLKLCACVCEYMCEYMCLEPRRAESPRGHRCEERRRWPRCAVRLEGDPSGRPGYLVVPHAGVLHVPCRCRGGAGGGAGGGAPACEGAGGCRGAIRASACSSSGAGRRGSVRGVGYVCCCRVRGSGRCRSGENEARPP